MFRQVHLSQGWWLLRRPAADSGGLIDVRFLGGCIAWAAGWGINLHADAMLRGLRKPGQNSEWIIVGGVDCLNELVFWA